MGGRFYAEVEFNRNAVSSFSPGLPQATNYYEYRLYNLCDFAVRFSSQRR